MSGAAPPKCTGTALPTAIKYQPKYQSKSLVDNISVSSRWQKEASSLVLCEAIVSRRILPYDRPTDPSKASPRQSAI
jgi:hypothetical protein